MIFFSDILLAFRWLWHIINIVPSSCMTQKTTRRCGTDGVSIWMLTGCQKMFSKPSHSHPPWISFAFTQDLFRCEIEKEKKKWLRWWQRHFGMTTKLKRSCNKVRSLLAARATRDRTNMPRLGHSGKEKRAIFIIKRKANTWRNKERERKKIETRKFRYLFRSERSQHSVRLTGKRVAFIRREKRQLSPCFSLFWFFTHTQHEEPR